MKKTETTKNETPALSDAELDKVAGGLSKIIQAKHDMQKGIIANFRV